MAIELGAAYLSILPSTDRLAPGIADALGDASKKAGDAGEEAGDNFGGGFSETLKKGAGLAAGLLLGAGLMNGLTQALEADAQNANLQASLGLTDAQAARAGDVAGSLYADNFGESMADVSGGIRSVIQNIDGMRGASEGALERISGKALSTSSLFEQDLGGVTRAVGQMMRTGLVSSADEAFDVLTVGFQNGADKSEDFLDTLNEYGTQFRKLGIDGKTATGLISQGLQAGARDGDLVADALKEFSIRAVDGSQTSKDAFAAMGLNAGNMADKIARGGDSAQRGLSTVLDRLRAMKDPVKREAAAVGIFGTQAEDLGDALFALDPSSAARKLGDVGNAAEKAQDQMSDTPAAQWASFTRTLQQGFVSVMGGSVVPAIMDAVGWIKQNKDLLITLAGVVGVLAAAYIAYTTTVRVITAITKAWTAVQIGLNIAMSLNPIGLVVAAIVLLVGAFILAWKRSSTFRAIVTAGLNAVKAAGLAVANFFTQKVPAAFQWMKDKAVAAVVAITSRLIQFVGWVKGLPGRINSAASGMWDKVKGWTGDAKDWIVGKLGDLVSWLRGLPGKIGSATSGMWDGIKNSFRSAVNSVIGWWNNLSFSLPGLTIKGKKIFDGITVGTPNIPYLAKGGLLTEPTLNVAGEAGPEAVVPLDRLEGWIEKAAHTGAANRDARGYANPSPASGSRRTEFVITNWRTGEGYFREIAEETYDGEREFAGTTGRMR